MLIGIDLSCWTNARGYGRFLRNILPALLRQAGEHRYVGIVDRESAGRSEFPAAIDIVEVELSESPTQAASADGRRRLSDVWRMSRAAQRARPDIFYFPTSYSYFPILGSARCLVTVHDAIAERWPKLVFPNRVSRLAWTAKNRLACWQASRVLTVSQAAARAIHQYLGVPW